MGAGRMLSVSTLSRKHAGAIFVPALTALIVAFGFAHFGLARFVFPESANDEALDLQPVWAGGLAPAANGPRTPPDALTSASFLLPIEKSGSPAPPAEPACPSGASCPSRAEQISFPPRKPQQRQAAAPPPPAKRQVIAAVQEKKPPDAAAQEPKPQIEAPKSSGWLDWSKIGDRLPKTESLLKPFSVVSDAVSGLVKRF